MGLVMVLTAFQTRPDVGRNGGGSGNHLGEVQRSMAPWKI